MLESLLECRVVFETSKRESRRDLLPECLRPRTMRGVL